MSGEIQKSQKPVRLVVEDDSQIAHLMDTAKFEHLQRIANMLGSAAFTPAHLKSKSPEETTANCFRVVNQAIRWGFDPFAVADETYVVQGKLGYQGKLVAAVLQTRAGLEGRLTQVYSGTGDNLKIEITGKFCGESSPRSITLTVGQAKTANKMWVTDPEQKLWYSGVIKWARRHCPEVIMGVLTEDDIERIAESTPPEPIKVVSKIPEPGKHSVRKPAPVAEVTPPAENLAEGEIPNDPEPESNLVTLPAEQPDPVDAMAIRIRKATTPAQLAEGRKLIEAGNWGLDDLDFLKNEWDKRAEQLKGKK